MTNSKVKDGNYIVVQAFMVKDLHLKGNELLTYAIIYGFSQNDQRFSGSLQYLSDWLNCSKQCVMANLKSLCDKDLIAKFEFEKNGVKFCEYRSKDLGGMQISCMGYANILHGGMQNSCTNNTRLYNNKYNASKRKKSALTKAEEQTRKVEAGTAALGELEREAIARMMRDYKQEGTE